MKNFSILIILILSLSSYAEVYEKSFSIKYLKEIKLVKSKIQQNCKRDISSNIKFRYMPIGLEKLYSSPNIAMTHFFDNEVWIEFSTLFDKLSTKQKLLTIYHEIGHSYKMEHKDDSIMTSPIEKVVEDYKSFYQELCPRLEHKI